MLNHVVLMGRLGADPELRTTQSGHSCCTFRIAVERDFKDKSTGERGVDWVNVIVWNTTAEYVAKYFTKGRVAVVVGRLQLTTYTDKNGNKRTATDVVANSVYFGDSRSTDTGNGEYSRQADKSDELKELNDDDGDLPF